MDMTKSNNILPFDKKFLDKISPICTPPVKFIINTWYDISINSKNLTLKQHDNSVFQRINSEKDKQAAIEFHNLFSKTNEGKNIRLEEERLKVMDSVLISSRKETILWSFPHQCRLWAKTELYKSVILRLLVEKNLVNISKFLLIVMEEKRKISFPLNDLELMIIRYCANYKAEPPRYQLLELEHIAHYYNLKRSQVYNATKKMWYYGIINTRFFINVAKLGFETYLLNEKLPSKFDPMLIIRVDFPENPIFIYQIPLTWDPPDTNFQIVKSMEYGHSLASLKPNGKITNTILMSIEEISSSITFFRTHEIDLEPNAENFVKNELKIIDYFNKGYNVLFANSTRIAEKFGISTTTVSRIIKDLVKRGVLYNSVTLRFLGFGQPVGLFFKFQDKSNIEIIKKFLKQFFHYHFLSNIDETEMFVYLVINDGQKEFLTLEISKFNEMNNSSCQILFLDLNNSLIRLLIDFRKISYEIDDFFGLKWNYQSMKDS